MRYWLEGEGKQSHQAGSTSFFFVFYPHLIIQKRALFSYSFVKENNRCNWFLGFFLFFCLCNFLVELERMKYHLCRADLSGPKQNDSRTVTSEFPSSLNIFFPRWWVDYNESGNYFNSFPPFFSSLSRHSLWLLLDGRCLKVSRCTKGSKRFRSLRILSDRSFSSTDNHNDRIKFVIYEFFFVF